MRTHLENDHVVVEPVSEMEFEWRHELAEVRYLVSLLKNAIDSEPPQTLVDQTLQHIHKVDPPWPVEHRYS